MNDILIISGERSSGISTFANPKSASFTDPFASTSKLAHLISLESGN